MSAAAHPFAQARRAILPPLQRKDFPVYIFGPYLTADQTVAPPQTPAELTDEIVEHARFLRYAAKKALEDKGFTVDFGETQEILDYWHDHFGASDPASAEIQHARTSGAIVMFPSSVGSICELGLFALNQTLSQKAYAIVHSKFNGDQSFFSKGLLEVFKAENGAVIHLDYTDHAACVAAAVDFVNARYSSAIRNMQQLEYLKNRGYGR